MHWRPIKIRRVRTSGSDGWRVQCMCCDRQTGCAFCFFFRFRVRVRACVTCSQNRGMLHYTVQMVYTVQKVYCTNHLYSTHWENQNIKNKKWNTWKWIWRKLQNVAEIMKMIETRHIWEMINSLKCAFCPFFLPNMTEEINNITDKISKISKFERPNEPFSEKLGTPQNAHVNSPVTTKSTKWPKRDIFEKCILGSSSPRPGRGKRCSFVGQQERECFFKTVNVNSREENLNCNWKFKLCLRLGKRKIWNLCQGSSGMPPAWTADQIRKLRDVREQLVRPPMGVLYPPVLKGEVLWLHQCNFRLVYTWSLFSSLNFKRLPARVWQNRKVW